MKYTLLKDVPLDRIKDNSLFSLEYPAPGDIKTDQDEKYGILYPPVLIQDDNYFYIIFGKRIIEHCRKYGKTLGCALVVNRLVNAYEMLKFNIHLKVELGGFNVVEKAITLKKAKELKGTIERDILKLLDIPFNSRIIEGYNKLADASEVIKHSILIGELNELTAFEIFKFLPEEREPVLNFIKKVALGTKKRNRILEMIYEISLRDGISPVELVTGGEIEKIFNQSMDPVHIGQKVFDYLEGLRYPSICNYRKRFNKKLKETGITRYFHFIPPPDFETSECKMILTFCSVKEFKEKLKKLEEIGEKKSFSELMEMSD